MPNAKGGRPRKTVDLVDLIGRRWSGQSFREIARQTGLGLGTVVRAHRQAIERVAALQNPNAAKLSPVTRPRLR
jgi:hypothetical protein